MSILSKLYQRLLGIIHARSQVAGLEISDTAVRYASLKKGSWQFEEVPVPPGTIVRGVLQDEASFITALRTLHERVFGKNRRRVGVIVSLSSAPLYSQVFTLPKLSEGETEKAVSLNMQMNSPLPLAESSSGWQQLHATTTNVEVLTASIPLSLAASMRRALEAAGFLPVVLEARSFSIARFIRTGLPGFDAEQPYLVVLVDDAGLDVLILMHGFLYFEFNSFWSDIQGDAPSISTEMFNEALARQVGQVLNFHRQHSTLPFKEALVIAPSMQDNITAALTERFGLTARPVQIGEPAFPLPWFVAAGSGLRGSMTRSQDTEINLIGISAQTAFQEDQVSTYLEFWRVMIPVALAVLLATSLAAYAFVANTRKKLDAQAATVHPGAQVAELSALETKAKDFNTQVASLATIQASLRPKSLLAADLSAAAQAGNVTLARVYLVPAPGASIVSGFAPSEDAVLAFKKKLQEDTRLTNLTLPIKDIRSTPQGISFSMTFKSDFAASSNTP